jgi:hypothetical protein
MASPVHHAETLEIPLGEDLIQPDAPETVLQSWPSDDLLAANLAALRQREPELATLIADAAVPSSYILALANDGSVTYRYLDRMGQSRWLGDCSVPKIFAESNIERIDLGSENLAVNGVGAGMDMALMLGRMSPYQGLFVLEPRAFNIKLVCQLHDFSQWLASGRLVLICSQSPEKTLEEFFVEHRGYNIVQKAAVLPYQSDQENHEFSQRLQIAMEKVLIPVMQEIQQLQVRQGDNDQQISKEDLWQAISSCSKLRATNATNTWSACDVLTSRDGLAGLAALGAETEWFVYDRPDCVSTEAQLQRIAKLGPQLVLLVDTFREDIRPSLPNSTVCATIIRELEESETTPELGEHDFVFVPRRQQLDYFAEAGVPDDRLFELPLAANTDIFQPTPLSDQEQLHYVSDVALVANRPSVDPKDYNINLPTHQKLWQSVINEIQLTPEKYQFDSAKRFLKRAQCCGVELTEVDMIDHFARLIQLYLGETVQREVFALEIVQNNYDLKIWGYCGLAGNEPNGCPKDWQASDLRPLATGCVSNGPVMNRLFNAAKIHLHVSSRGWMDQAVLDGIAAGAFFLVKSHPNDGRPGGLGQYFEPGKEVVTFDSPKDLVRKIKYYLTHERERKAIAATARDKCLAQHSMKKRMEEMLEMISQEQKV